MLRRKNTGGRLVVFCLVLCFVASGAFSAERFRFEKYQGKDNDWYRSDEAKLIAENILSWQDEYGSWPKNLDTSANPYTGQRSDLEGTFDNRAMTDEMRYMARIFNATNDSRYSDAFINGLELIFKAQYPTGGWPQHFPPGDGYARYITFNDDAMIRIMELLEDVISDSTYIFVSDDRINDAKKAFDDGLDCILKCQVRVDGKLTVWCAQHDEIDYQPRPARSFELVSLSGGESSGILHFLMNLKDPSPEVVKAITSGVRWYRDSEVKGIRIAWVDGKLKAMADPDARSLWGRFYDINSNHPIFCDRDGIPKYDYNQIDQERSTGYKWYGDWGVGVLGEYEKWKQKWAARLPEDTIVLAIVGDSTVCNYELSQVRRGWGQFIQGYFKSPIEVVNTARSGRSTKTFIKEGLWKQTLELKPSYILIQFGHNDSHAPEKTEATDAETTYSDYLRQYVDQSRQIGAVPIFVTPMYRRHFDENGKIKDNLLPYADAMKKIAAEKKVAVVDLNSASEKLYLKLGEDGSKELANEADDMTHFNEKGAKLMAGLVMEQLVTTEPSLGEYLKEKVEKSAD